MAHLVNRSGWHTCVTPPRKCPTLLITPSRDGHTALHGAGFLGYADIVDLLIQRGADINLPSDSGETPLHSAEQNFETVQYIAGLIGLQVEKGAWWEGRKKVVEQLHGLGAKSLAGGVEDKAQNQASTARKIWNGLVNIPVFILVWFLWFLVWLIAIFAVFAFLSDRLGWRGGLPRLILSPMRLLWLVPLTVVPTWLMQFEFGPDTSMAAVTNKGSNSTLAVRRNHIVPVSMELVAF